MGKWYVLVLAMIYPVNQNVITDLECRFPLRQLEAPMVRSLGPMPVYVLLWLLWRWRGRG